MLEAVVVVADQAGYKVPVRKVQDHLGLEVGQVEKEMGAGRTVLG